MTSIVRASSSKLCKPKHFHCTKRLSLHRFYSSSSKETTEHQRNATNLPSPRLDYRNISENVVYKSTNALNRKAPLPPDAIQSVVRAYKEFKDISLTLNAKRNSRSILGEKLRKVAQEKDADAKKATLAEAKQLKDEISTLEKTLQEIEDHLLALALAIPNDTHPSSPLGPEPAAITLSTHGPEPLPASPNRDHVTIGKKLGLLDLESAANVTGTSWYYLKNEAALLEMALQNYALSIAIKHGFTPVTTPDVVRLDVAKRCGFQPRDSPDSPASQFFHVETPTASPELILSGTSEIPLAGLFVNKLYSSEQELPLKVVGIGRAFRAEAGSRGTDTRGLYRVHQFTKVELFAVTADDQSEPMMEEMKMIQTRILNGLGLSFRVLDMPSEELGSSAYRKYDMEAWMPGRGKWGEVSSLSNCTDYQARRLLTRYSKPIPSTPQFSANVYAHTLNGTAAAIPRLIVALLENGARFDDSGEVVSIDLPGVLRPFWPDTTPGRGIVRWIT